MTRQELKILWQDKLSDVSWETVKRCQFHEKVNDDPDKLVKFVRSIVHNRNNRNKETRDAKRRLFWLPVNCTANGLHGSMRFNLHQLLWSVKCWMQY